MNSTNIKQAYSEVAAFLTLLTDEEREKVPSHIINKINSEKDESYIVNIDPNKDIAEQNLKSETLAIIAMLNLNYWCDDEEEKERLRKVYEENQKKYDETIQIDFDPNRIFVESKVIENTDYQTDETILPVIKKESVFSKILNKLKTWFFRNKK